MYVFYMNEWRRINNSTVCCAPPTPPRPKKKDCGVAKAEINFQLINIIVTVVVDEFI